MADAPKLVMTGRLTPDMVKYCGEEGLSAEIHRALSDIVDLLSTKLDPRSKSPKNKRQNILNEQLRALTVTNGLKFTITAEVDSPEPIPLSKQKVLQFNKTYGRV